MTNALHHRIVTQMLEKDAFSRWLGVELTGLSPGKCTLQLRVRSEMLNGFSIAHGGITYSLADSALAFASNGHGKKALSVETSISHLEAVRENDVLTATAEEVNRSEKFGLYVVQVMNQEKKLVAMFKGTVYVTSKEWVMSDK